MNITAVGVEPDHALFLQLLKQSPKFMRELEMYPAPYAEKLKIAAEENRELTEEEINQLREILTAEQTEFFLDREEELVTT